MGIIKKRSNLFDLFKGKEKKIEIEDKQDPKVDRADSKIIGNIFYFCYVFAVIFVTYYNLRNFSTTKHLTILIILIFIFSIVIFGLVKMFPKKKEDEDDEEENYDASTIRIRF